jgi:hypothetical protein
MQSFSNWAHWGEAAVLALAACLALAEAAGHLKGERGRSLWPVVITAAGGFLLLYLLIPYHGLKRAPAQWAFIVGEPQQRQHLVFSALTLVGGGAELLYRARRLEDWRWQLVWPAAAVVMGVMFAAHAQHGTTEAVHRAMLVHRYLGILLIGTGLLRSADVLLRTRIRWVAFSWGLTLLGAAVLLAVYREPDGAYRTEHASGHQAHAVPDSTPARRDSMREHPQ